MSTGIKAGLNRPAESHAGKSCRGGQLGALLLFVMGMPVLMAAQATTTTLAITVDDRNVSSVDGGAVVNLTATVENGGKAVTPGFVNFCDATAKICSDIHLLGTAPLNAKGQAALNFVPRAGQHSYKAEFGGTLDAKGKALTTGSVSTAHSLLVYGITKTTIASSGTPGHYTLKATVTGTASEAEPAGHIEFLDTSDYDAVLATEALKAGSSGLKWLNTQNPATKPQPLSISVGDFNGDGIPDIAIGTNGTSSGYLSILLGNGNGTFQAAKTVTGLANNQAMVAAPFVNGGPIDILTVDSNVSGTNNAALFISDGKGGGKLGTPFSLGGVASVSAVAAADFNRDGNEDFVITGVIYGVYCFAPVMGNGNGTFGGPTLNAVGNDPLLVAVGAFGPKGYPDIVVTDTGVGQVTIFQNNSAGYFVPGGQANTGSNPTAMTTGDFNGDGNLDVAVVNSDSKNVTILLGNGNYTLTPAAASPSTGKNPTSIAVGDFNGDGIADLAVVNSGDRTVSILLGKGDGTFVSGTPLSTGINPVNVAAGNFSGNGLSDLAVTNQDIAATTGSTLTVQAAEWTQTATATATPVSPGGSGTHKVEASYGGDSLYNTSVSATTSLVGVPSAAQPVLSPAGRTYYSAQKVTLTDTTKGALMYYTTDGTTPTTKSTKYSKPIAVSASQTINAIAVATGLGDSRMASDKYVIEVAAPVFTPAGATYSSAQKVTLTDKTAGAVIYYTTNGKTPTTASTKYTGAITVSVNETLKAIAVAKGYPNSTVSSATYTIK